MRFATAPLTGLMMLATAATTAAAAERTISYDTAVLRWLDKVTARAKTISVPVGETLRIHTLEIIIRTCVEPPPEEPPESAVFMDVWEVKPGEPTQEVFRGWMFASSPALSAMEHPVYDVWVLDCRNSDKTSASDSSE